MKTSSRLLLAIVAVVLMAPPAYPQKLSTQDQLNQLTIDMLNLTNAFKVYQESSDKKSAEIKAAVDQLQGRFTAIDNGFIRLGDSLSAIKTTDEKTVRDVESVRQAVVGLKDNFGPISEGFSSLQLQVRGIKDELVKIQTVETPLPSAADTFNEAYLSFSQGLYSIALSGFQDFLKTHDRDVRAPLAHIYMGEAYSADKKFEQALVEYEFASQNYPDSDKKCLALYKKGRTLVELKDNPRASAALQEVGKQCPGSDEAKLASEDLKKPPFVRGGRN